MISASDNGRPAVFLDRDGVVIETDVVNGKPYAIRDLAALKLLPGVADATDRLKSAGFALVVVTNQPDIANGKVAAETVEAMHDDLRNRLPLDAIYCCPHSQGAGCDCRKPEPGMLTRAAKEHALDLARSFMVGDRKSDVEAGRRAGCRTVFIDCGYAEGPPATCDATVRDLPEAANWILRTTTRR